MRTLALKTLFLGKKHQNSTLELTNGDISSTFCDI